MQMSRAWRERSSAPIRMHYSTLPKIVVVYKLFHLSLLPLSIWFLFLFIFLRFIFFFSLSLSLYPPETSPFSTLSHSTLCFARISRCITVVIACRDCLQLSERMSVCLCTIFSVSLVIVFGVFFLFGLPPLDFWFVSLYTQKPSVEKEDWWRN